jgi:hypothetical protein
VIPFHENFDTDTNLESFAGFSRDVEKVILRISQALIFPLANLINSELLIISLWKKLRFFGA